MNETIKRGGDTMVRPFKEGIDYFPLDTDMDQDDKVAIIEAKHGIEGFAVLLKLFMKIYKEGYFYEWNEREQLLFSRRVNVNINLVREIVTDCIEEGLFDRNLFEEHRVLTSTGIQKRYLEAVKRRKEVRFMADFFLIQDVNSVLGNSKTAVILVHGDGNEVNVNNNSKNADKSTQRKVKERESKGKESKVKQSKELHAQEKEPAAGDDALVFYQQNFGLLRPSMSEKILAWIEDMGDELVIRAMEKALEQNKNNWSYAEAILRRWSEQGIDSLDKVEAEEVQFQNQSKTKGSKSFGNEKRDEVIPSWFNKQKKSLEKPRQNEPLDIEHDAIILDSLVRMDRSFESIISGDFAKYNLSPDDLAAIKENDVSALEILKSKTKLRAVGD
ncbi:DUF4373 domain-containing protein [Halobacillus fulvus]|nr:DUF4373 domain-containing protein [Halobacillus fulvus]